MENRINTGRIHELVDIALLNAFALESSGLYYGKAGVSLGLFGVANALQDEYIEEKAFELLQESLLTRIKNVDFKSGLSGIGFTLCFLKEMNWVDLDFPDIFGEQTKTIIETCSNIDSIYAKYGLKCIDIISFLTYIKTKESRMIQTQLINKVESYMGGLFEKMKSNQISMYEAINEWEYFLRKILCLSLGLNDHLLNRYQELHNSGLLPSNEFISFYLKYLSGNKTEEENKTKSNSYSSDNAWLTFPLEKQLQYYLIKKDNGINLFPTIDSLYINSSDLILKQALLKYMPLTESRISYGDGISRLLLFLSSYMYGNQHVRTKILSLMFV